MPSRERRRGGSDNTARRLLRILLPLLLLALGAPRLAIAAVPASAPASAPAAPTAAEPPRIGVLTMGPGDIFWERFGHDSIVVADPAWNEPTSYNFGFFDLNETGFIRRFIEGRMQYMLVALPLSEDLDYYRRVGRGVRLQWLDLTPAQARALATALAENARPENARYHYDYFTSNCTTKVRDALDRALDGRLRRQTENRSSGDSYRSESLRLAAPAPWLWVGFDIALGPSNDRALTRWQQDFLPRRLADDLRQIRLDDGRPLVMPAACRCGRGCWQASHWRCWSAMPERAALVRWRHWPPVSGCSAACLGLRWRWPGASPSTARSGPTATCCCWIRCACCCCRGRWRCCAGANPRRDSVSCFWP